MVCASSREFLVGRDRAPGLPRINQRGAPIAGRNSIFGETSEQICRADAKKHRLKDRKRSQNPGREAGRQSHTAPAGFGRSRSSTTRKRNKTDNSIVLSTAKLESSRRFRYAKTSLCLLFGADGVDRSARDGADQARHRSRRNSVHYRAITRSVARIKIDRDQRGRP